MKFALCEITDQTYCYLTEEGDLTVSHLLAFLWGTREEADEAFKIYGLDETFGWVQEVLDEEEFRSKEDTW